MTQLATASGFGLAIDLDVSALNDVFRLTAGSDELQRFHKLIQPDVRPFVHSERPQNLAPDLPLWTAPSKMKTGVVLKNREKLDTTANFARKNAPVNDTFLFSRIFDRKNAH